MLTPPASNRFVRSALTLTLAAAGLSGLTACAQTATGPIPTAKVADPLARTSSRETAVFAGGCFWGTQAVFERIKGVVKTTAGYSGGKASTATYDQVTTETTGHAESVQVVFDPSVVSYATLLRVYYTVIDPTTLNRQGPDAGTSYRSAIFYATPEQGHVAQAYTAQLTAEHVFKKPIVVQITPLKGFYAGEEYHQDYALKNPDNPYIEVCDRPKIAALKADYPELYTDYKGAR